MEGGSSQLTRNLRLGLQNGHVHTLKSRLVGQRESDWACTHNDDVFARMHYGRRYNDNTSFEFVIECKFSGRICNHTNPNYGSLKRVHQFKDKFLFIFYLKESR